LKGGKPQLKVIHTSGYSADVAGKGPTLVEGVNFLQKPCHPHKPAQTVRDRLVRKSQAAQQTVRDNHFISPIFRASQNHFPDASFRIDDSVFVHLQLPRAHGGLKCSTFK